MERIEGEIMCNENFVVKILDFSFDVSVK